MDGDANWALSFPREFALWGDPHGELPERPSVLVQDFGLCDPSDLWLFEAAAGRGLAQVHWDSVWIGNATPMNQKLKFKWQDSEWAALHNLCVQGFSGKCMIWDAALLYPPETSVADRRCH